MGFLDKIFKKTKKITGEAGGDRGSYLSEDGKTGIFISGGSQESRGRSVDELRKNMDNISETHPSGKIREALEKLNTSLYNEGKVHSGVVVYETEKYVLVAHIGLARAYAIRENEIIQLTEDDTEGWNLFKTGVLTEERLRTTPLNKLLKKALGKSSNLQVNTMEYYFSPGETVLLIGGEEAMEVGDEKIYDLLSPEDTGAFRGLKLDNYLLKRF